MAVRVRQHGQSKRAPYSTAMGRAGYQEWSRKGRKETVVDKFAVSPSAHGSATGELGSKSKDVVKS
jgi:hypothetical protein